MNGFGANELPDPAALRARRMIRRIKI